MSSWHGYILTYSVVTIVLLAVGSILGNVLPLP
jgi:hypothetical protein